MERELLLRLMLLLLTYGSWRERHRLRIERKLWLVPTMVHLTSSFAETHAIHAWAHRGLTTAATSTATPALATLFSTSRHDMASTTAVR